MVLCLSSLPEWQGKSCSRLPSVFQTGSLVYRDQGLLLALPMNYSLCLCAALEHCMFLLALLQGLSVLPAWLSTQSLLGHIVYRNCYQPFWSHGVWWHSPQEVGAIRFTMVEPLLLLLLRRFSLVQLCATPLTAAHQAPLSLGFSRQGHWSGLPFPSPMHESEKWEWSRSVVSDS